MLKFAKCKTIIIIASPVYLNLVLSPSPAHKQGLRLSSGRLVGGKPEDFALLANQNALNLKGRICVSQTGKTTTAAIDEAAGSKHCAIYKDLSLYIRSELV